MGGEHTPGPWAAFTDDVGLRPHTNIVAFEGRTQCVFSLPGRDKAEPDVRLIVAAPGLLEALMDTAASLAATISLLERSPKTAAPSNRMFDQMLADYRASLDRARAALLKATARTTGQEVGLPELPSADAGPFPRSPRLRE